MNEKEANAKGREQLLALASRLTDKELRLQAGDGWTVSAVLAHLAFYDYRALGLIQYWKKNGVGPSPLDTDIVNDAMKLVLVAIAGREAVKLALAAAEAVDAEIEKLPEELRPGIDVLVKEGKFRLNRGIHREAHIEQIEKALADNR